MMVRFKLHLELKGKGEGLLSDYSTLARNAHFGFHT